MIFPLVLSLIISCAVTAISVALFLPLIKKMGLIDDPKTHKHPAIIHLKPTPRGGGIPLFIGILITSLIFIPINNTTIALFVAAFISLIVGTIDDRYDISRYFRFFVNIVCAVIVVKNGITIPFITSPMGGILHLDTIKFFTISLADLLAVLWIVWVMNMLNWSKGVDGQMPGIVAISSIVIGILSLRFPLSDQLTTTAAFLSFIIAGAAIGFLFFNFYPAKIFPGYGATAMYLLLASVSMLSSVKLATAVLVMGVPLIDGTFTIIRRIISKRSPFKGDRRHLHHMLLQLGLGQRSVALFYWIVSAIVGAIALTLSNREKIFAIIMLGVVISGALLFLHSTLTEHDQE